MKLEKFKQMFTNMRVIILLLFVVFAYVAINGGAIPHLWDEGVAIRSVAVNSSSAIAGIESPTPTTGQTDRERIISINSKPINSVEDYYSMVSDIEPNRTLHIKTNKKLYKLTTKAETLVNVLNETEIVEIVEEIYDNETNSTYNETREVEVNKTETIIIGTQDIGLKVYLAPKTNIYKGLDLQGGMRILLQPEEELAPEDMEFLIENMETRLNVYGLSDLVIRESKDLSGNQYIIVEIPGAQEDEVTELLSKQGKFSASVGNETVFSGGEDILYVCRSADCSGIDPRRGCSQANGAWGCTFHFAITLSAEAAQRQADATKGLDVIVGEDGDKYLSEKLVLYLDGQPMDELNIAAGLQGKAVTDIAISGPGMGQTQELAMQNTLDNMKQMQTILATGSLPTKLEVVKTDAISPVFGDEFVRNALLMGLLALLAVGVVVGIRYRSLKIALPMILTSLFEAFILLGVAAFIRHSIDLASIAGILISVGSGVDHLIVITDETLKGSSQVYDWKKKIKEAFSIVFVAYFTTCAAMIPLIWAGAGMLKGFALVTLIGVSIGVLIARPAYAKVIEILLKD